MTKRITVFMGAGSAIEINGPTTDEITKIVKNIKIDTGNDFQTNFIKQVSGRLETYYNQQTVNFEEIFHAIERLNSYMYAWRSESVFNLKISKETARLYKPALGAFLEPTSETDKYFKNNWIGIVLSAIISKVCTRIREYDKTFDINNQEYEWYCRFWKHLNTNALLDVSTLNYDTIIERVIKGNDGFDVNGKFNAPMLDDKAKNKILHLHGCINYGPQIDSPQYQELVKYEDYNTAENLRSRYIKNYSINQNGEFSVMGPLLIGLNKTEKIQAVPYIFYNAEFTKNIVQNNSLLIVGYSFGDNYLNELLSNFTTIHGKNKKLFESILDMHRLYT